MNSAKPTLGFAGLGKMGHAMATNLAKAGYPLKVYNRTFSKAQSLESLGATAVRTPAELGDVDIVFTMTNDAHALQEILFDGGLLEAMSKAAAAAPNRSVRPLHVSCATLPVDFVQEIVQKHTDSGVDYAAMPVIGRPDAAAAGKLHLLFAGSPDVRTRLEPVVVPAVGQTFRDYGAEPHRANVMKISFNMMLMVAIESISEGSALVQRYGMTSHEFTSLLSETLFDCTAYRGYGSIISNRAFLPAGASLTGVGLKDTMLALRTGEQARVPLPYASVARDHLLDAIANGMGEWDWSAVAVVAEQHAGLTPTPAPIPGQKRE
ncbi:putative mitochondrial 2-hydroxy-3-oxopropionate reductase [Leptomonas pyrrhocoris]|uniref:Putative mitochondrial 2-hydroxy-3-oxopropionate reductase n=1 Tax=Leptomonas pyrrhocoris TaxID=157538 RepID=A0A0N0VEP0_LEPPY|nr:putative mitochondrial 2-hydroxy-3-oxopropionate reductase [Leptomonas pyrrhocoris]KPA78932.1 putative mitochondrial 2-hydroxy-3-oxopropionate reductase [Leptomonas pyrrhocoris]|eukprot:XP_015657371.1 putative mitochondrial 2-hydroxy-3-oxopropionate reductase [Leptomonas pyrrhocoris]